jgi:WD40 repeat protein
LRPFARLRHLLAYFKLARVSAARWIDAFWGYDVFIAHRRKDAADYAFKLYNKLTDERVTAFIDREIYGPGDSLLIATRRHVAKSTLFLLLGSPEIHSVRQPVDWVEREIDTYLSTHVADPKLILVDFGGTIETALASLASTTAAQNPILSQLAPFFRLRQEMSALSQAPSDEVLDAVLRSLKGRRRERNRLRFFEGMATILALLLLVAVGLGLVARQQRNVALEETARARANEYATKARGLTSSAPREAVLAAVEATRQTTNGSPEPISQETLSAAVTQLRGVPLPGYGTFRDELSGAFSLAISDDASRAAVGDWSGSVFLWNIANRARPSRIRVLAPLRRPWVRVGDIAAAPVTNVGLSTDGRWTAVVTPTSDGISLLRILDMGEQGDPGAPPRVTYSGEYSKVETTSINNRFLLLGKDHLTIEVLDLNRQAEDPRPMSTRRSERPILAVTMTTDGRLDVSIDDLGAIVVWTVATGTLLKSITLPALVGLPSAWDDNSAFKKSFKVTSLRLSPDGKYLALLARLPSERVQPQQMAQLWDISQRTPLVVSSYPRTKGEFGNFDEGDGNLVTDIEFSPDSKYMALSHNHELKLWDLSLVSPAGSPTRVSLLPGEYSTLAYSPDAKRIASGDSDGGVLTLNLDDIKSDAKIALRAQDGAGQIGSLIFSKNGDSLLASGEKDSAWLLSTEREITGSGYMKLAPPALQQGETIHVSDDGSIAAGLSTRGLWLASLGDLATRLMPLPDGMKAGAKQHVHLYADGRCAVLWDDATPRLYIVNLRSGIARAATTSIEYSGPSLPSLTFDAAGRWVVASDNLNHAVLISLDDNGQHDRQLNLTDYEGGGLIFNTESTWLLSGVSDAIAGPSYKPHLWKLGATKIDHYLLPAMPSGNLEGYEFSRDGRWLAASEGYNPVQGHNNVFVWTMDGNAGPREKARISAHIMKSGVAFSPDGQWMISFDNLPGAMDASANYLPKRLCLWKIPQFDKPVWERTFRVQSIEASFSPDSSWLTVGTDGTLSATLVDLRARNLQETSPFDSGATTVGDWKFTFSPDGRWFTTHGFNASVRLWQFDGRRNPVLVEQNLVPGSGNVTFSTDSRTLAASDTNVTRVLWLNASAPRLRQISLPAGGTPYLHRNDSSLILQSSEAVSAFELDSSRMVASLGVKVGRNLSWPEWNSLFPDRPYSKTFADLPADASVASEYMERAETAARSGERKAARDLYSAAVHWALEAGHPVAANEVAWSAITRGFPNIGLPAAELAIQEDPFNGEYRDTRGVARCAMGDSLHALDDFKAYVEWAQALAVPQSSLTQRRDWMATLETGKLPADSCTVALD